MVKRKLKFGSKITHKGTSFFVTDVTPRTIKVRKIFEKSRSYQHGRLGNLVRTIKKKEL